MTFAYIEKSLKLDENLYIILIIIPFHRLKFYLFFNKFTHFFIHQQIDRFQLKFIDHKEKRKNPFRKSLNLFCSIVRGSV